MDVYGYVPNIIGIMQANNKHVIYCYKLVEISEQAHWLRKSEPTGYNAMCLLHHC